jgi:hypothetical protein
MDDLVEIDHLVSQIEAMGSELLDIKSRTTKSEPQPNQPAAAASSAPAVAAGPQAPLSSVSQVTVLRIVSFSSFGFIYVPSTLLSLFDGVRYVQ